MQSGNDQEKEKAQRPSKPTFAFKPRWKEQLVVTSKNGSFVLELPMGVLSAYLPTQDVWREIAPLWAKDNWPELRQDLEVWCKQNNAKFIIDATATVDPEKT